MFGLDLHSWAELVFHVLAHVRPAAQLPASVYDPGYVRFVEACVGPADSRQLAHDAEVLAKTLASHEKLARVQLLAWLFHTPERASGCSARDLAALAPQDVDEPALLSVLASVGPAIELLRCATALELETFRRLPPAVVDRPRLQAALTAVLPAAPALEECRVFVVRSLRLRGRIWRDQILIGQPQADGEPSFEHVSWQAAHEATVQEVSRCGEQHRPSPSEREVERAAVVLLAERARDCGLECPHRKWLDHFGSNAPPADRGSLPPALQELVERCRAAGQRSTT